MISLLLNVLIIVMCIFVYYISTLINFEEKYRPLLIGAVSLVGIFLCIKFPFYDINGHRYDLRIIPLLVGGLYGGRKVVISLFIGLILFRMFLGGVNIGLMVTIVQSSLVSIFTYITTKRFNELSTLQKIMIGLIFLLVMWTVNFGNHLLFLPSVIDGYSLSLIIFHTFITFLSYILVIWIIEYIRFNRLIQDQINNSEKMRVISELAASVSHEVRNPLTVTRGFLQLLKDDGINFQKRKDYLDLALSELDRAQEIITDYLTYAKPSVNIEYVKLNLAEEIGYLTQVMNPYALMSGVELIVDEVDKGYYISGDDLKFRQFLINITKNGIEAMPRGGELVIKAMQRRNKVIIMIRDFGVGMPSELVAKLGSPFHSTKAKGTGLGTMVAYSIVRAMKGKIKVVSKEGRGTTFYFSFPLDKGKSS